MGTSFLCFEGLRARGALSEIHVAGCGAEIVRGRFLKHDVQLQGFVAWRSNQGKVQEFLHAKLLCWVWWLFSNTQKLTEECRV